MITIILKNKRHGLKLQLREELNIIGFTIHTSIWVFCWTKGFSPSQINVKSVYEISVIFLDVMLLIMLLIMIIITMIIYLNIGHPFVHCTINRGGGWGSEGQGVCQSSSSGVVPGCLPRSLPFPGSIAPYPCSSFKGNPKPQVKLLC